MELTVVSVCASSVLQSSELSFKGDHLSNAEVGFQTAYRSMAVKTSGNYYT